MSAERPRAWLRGLTGGLIAVSCLALGYAVVASVWLPKLIARHTQNSGVKLRAETVYSLYPGRVELRAIEARSLSSNCRATAEAASLNLRLTSVFSHNLEFEDVHVQGAKVFCEGAAARSARVYPTTSHWRSVASYNSLPKVELASLLAPALWLFTPSEPLDAPSAAEAIQVPRAKRVKVELLEWKLGQWALRGQSTVSATNLLWAADSGAEFDQLKSSGTMAVAYAGAEVTSSLQWRTSARPEGVSGQSRHPPTFHVEVTTSAFTWGHGALEANGPSIDGILEWNNAGFAPTTHLQFNLDAVSASARQRSLSCTGVSTLRVAPAKPKNAASKLSAHFDAPTCALAPVTAAFKDVQMTVRELELSDLFGRSNVSRSLPARLEAHVSGRVTTRTYKAQLLAAGTLRVGPSGVERLTLDHAALTEATLVNHTDTPGEKSRTLSGSASLIGAIDVAALEVETLQGRAQMTGNNAQSVIDIGELEHLPDWVKAKLAGYPFELSTEFRHSAAGLHLSELELVRGNVQVHG